MRKKPLKPCEVRTFNQVCALPRDSIYTRDFWFMVSGDTVELYKQRAWHESTASISIPKATFDGFLRWYTTGSRKKRKA